MRGGGGIRIVKRKRVSRRAERVYEGRGVSKVKGGVETKKKGQKARNEQMIGPRER